MTSWTTPPTFTGGEVGASADMNTISGDLNYLHTMHGAKHHNASGQSPANGTWTQLSYSNTDWDTDSFISGNYFVAPVTGYYLVVASVTFNANGTGWRGLGIRVNQTGTSGPNNLTILVPCNSVSHTPQIEASDILSLTAGDKVDFVAYQDSGGTLNISDETARIKFEGV